MSRGRRGHGVCDDDDGDGDAGIRRRERMAGCIRCTRRSIFIATGSMGPGGKAKANSAFVLPRRLGVQLGAVEVLCRATIRRATGARGV